MSNLDEPSLPLVRIEHDGELGNGHHFDVKPDLKVPAFMSGTVTTEELPGLEFKISLEWKPQENRYAMTRLAIATASGITTTAMHSISIPKLHKYLAAGNVLIGATDEDHDEKYLRFEDVIYHEHFAVIRARINTEGPTDEALSWVGRVYSWAKIIGQNPNSTVVSVLKVPQRTATRWIARAKAEGYID